MGPAIRAFARPACVRLAGASIIQEWIQMTSLTLLWSEHVSMGRMRRSYLRIQLALGSVNRTRKLIRVTIVGRGRVSEPDSPISVIASPASTSTRRRSPRSVRRHADLRTRPARTSPISGRTRAGPREAAAPTIPAQPMRAPAPEIFLDPASPEEAKPECTAACLTAGQVQRWNLKNAWKRTFVPQRLRLHGGPE